MSADSYARRRSTPASTATPSTGESVVGDGVAYHDKYVKDALGGKRDRFNVPLEFPSSKELLAAIPKECYEISTFTSSLYLATSIAMTVACGWLGWTYLPYPTLVSSPLWALFAIVQGTIMLGIWVQAHECGHGAWSNNKLLQDIVGFVCHSSLLVPYFSWQRSHAIHHSRTNHLTENESFVPDTAGNAAGKTILDRFEWLGEDAFALTKTIAYLLIAWPNYMMRGSVGTARGRSNHFIPYNDDMFPGKWKLKVYLSGLGVVTAFTILGYCIRTFGFAPVVAMYFGPYLVVNAWLILYTWLHHTDVDVPHYSKENWSWVKGALSTIDRPYGPVIDFLHHGIGSTHVAHHVCSRIPHYNAWKATDAIAKAFPEYYMKDTCSIWESLWRVARKCVVVINVQGRYVFAGANPIPPHLVHEKEKF